MKNIRSVLMLLMMLLSSYSAYAALGGNGTANDTLVDIALPNLGNLAQTFDQESYDIECSGREVNDNAGVAGIQIGKVEGDVVIDSPLDVEQKKCVTKITGNLLIRAYKITSSPGSNIYCQQDCLTMEYMVLPWLTKVGGNLTLSGNHELKKPRLPRLHYVGGKISVGSDKGQSTWVLNSLKSHYNTLKAKNSNGARFDGFALTYLKRLELSSQLNINSGPYYSGLQSLETLGSLKITTRYAAASNNFLASLETINGSVDLNIYDDIYGLQSVKTIGGTLEIQTYQGNNFHGLESLEEVGGSLEWNSYNQAIGNLQGLQNLQTVGGDLELPLYVSSLAGLENLASVGDDFSLSGYISNATNLAQLSNLGKVGGTFSIDYLPLQNLDGLENLSQLGGLVLTDNYNLDQVYALGNAQMINNGSVTITGNSPLSNCEANYLVSSLTNNSPGWTGNVTVANNANCTVWSGIRGSITLPRD